MDSIKSFGCFKTFAQSKLTAFDSFFPELSKLLKELDEVSEANDWFDNVLSYNVPNGKKSRGLLTVCTQYHLDGEKVPTNPNVERAIALGWCVELLQACCLVADDIMDNSTLRRGSPCWYMCDGVGMAAVNDAFYLESCTYALLKGIVGGLPMYSSLVDLFLNVTRKTIYGQTLDFLLSKLPVKKSERFVLSRALQIAKFKTSYYTFYLPIRAGMILENSNDAVEIEIVEKACIILGQIFQANDDFLDVFEDPAASGKVGTDIAEGKCTWIFCKSLEVASPKQKAALLENYGGGDGHGGSIIVKEIMNDLDLPSLFEKYVREEKRKMMEQIGQLSTKGLKEIFELLLNDIC